MVLFLLTPLSFCAVLSVLLLLVVCVTLAVAAVASVARVCVCVCVCVCVGLARHKCVAQSPAAVEACCGAHCASCTRCFRSVQGRNRHRCSGSPPAIPQSWGNSRR